MKRTKTLTGLGGSVTIHADRLDIEEGGCLRKKRSTIRLQDIKRVYTNESWLNIKTKSNKKHLLNFGFDSFGEEKARRAVNEIKDAMRRNR